MTKLEKLEKEFKSYWKNTKEERETTHTSALYKKSLKNKKKWTIKKRTIVWALLNVGVVIFIFMSITFYYLVPATVSVMDYLQKLVESLLKLFM